jgi:hypothetical protein
VNNENGTTLNVGRKVRRIWTTSEDDLLRSRYADEPTESIAAALKRTMSSVYYRARRIGLYKSAAFLARLRSDVNQKLLLSGETTRFHPGQKPWNRGIRFDVGGRSSETRFKPGHKTHNWRPIGYERMTRDGHLERKVTDTGVKRIDYRLVHHLVWRAAGREIPPGHVLTFRDGDKRNFDLDNLELLPRKQLMQRNSCHNYGPEVAKLVQLRVAINRQINQKEWKVKP